MEPPAISFIWNNDNPSSRIPKKLQPYVLKNVQISQIIKHNSQASIYGHSTIEVRSWCEVSNSESRDHMFCSNAVATLKSKN